MKQIKALIKRFPRVSTPLLLTLLLIVGAVGLYRLDYLILSANSKSLSEAYKELEKWRAKKSYPDLFSEITQDEKYRYTIQQILTQLERAHYSAIPFDRTQSEKLADHILYQMDPTRSFLLAEDALLIQKETPVMMTATKAGKLNHFYNLYEIYRQRTKKRYENMVQFVEESHLDQDFTVEESIFVRDEKSDWAKTEEELDEIWRLQHKLATLNLLLADKTVEESQEILRKRYQRHLDLQEKMRGDDVFAFLANLLTTFYDPHSQYFSERQYENFAIQMNLSLQGIGVVLKLEDEYPTVQRIVPGGPADLSRELRVGDRIVAVAQGAWGEFEDVVGWRLDDIVELIRGDAGSTVRLQILPADPIASRSYRTITLVRNEVRLEEQAAQKKIVELEEIPYKLGVVKVPTFYRNFQEQGAGKKDFKSSARDVQRLLRELEEEGAEGVVIDLRDNGGGSLEEAISLSSLFLPPNRPILQVLEKRQRPTEMVTSKMEFLYQKPVVVLVNRQSASASEIFAAALQDYQRAPIVGEQTYGKGTVQRIVMLYDGQMKYTSAMFYRVNGESTQHQGVLPDVLFPSYVDHQVVGESALHNPLPKDYTLPHARFRPLGLIPSVDWLQARHLEQNLLHPDYIYLYKNAQLVQERRDLTEFSLLLSERQAENERDQKLRLQYENERRARKKQPALDSLDQLKSEEEEEKQLIESAYNRGIEDSDEEPDIILRASARVLAQLIAYQNGERSLQATKK